MESSSPSRVLASTTMPDTATYGGVAEQRVCTWSALLAAFCFPLIVLLFSPVEIIDDAYISYRYALQLVVGEGLVLNPGEYVEGYTNLLWTLLMALPTAFDLPVHVVGMAMGVVFGLLAMRDAARLCRLLQIGPVVTTIAVGTLGLVPGFWLTMANGLEGGLFSFLVTRTIYMLLAGSWSRAGIWGSLLFVTRPESLVVVPICVLFAVLFLRDAEATPGWMFRHRVVPMIMPWLAVIIVATIWRISTYGAWLPNTVTAKSVPFDEGLLIHNMLKGLRYGGEYLVSVLPLALGSVLAVLLAPRRSATWLCLALVGAQMLPILINGGDWMPHYRLLAVYTPLLVVPLAVTLQALSSATWNARRHGMIVRGACGLLLALSLIVMLGRHTWAAVPAAAWRTTEPCWQVLASAVGPVLRPTDVVSPEALGVFGYMLPHIPMHDMLGLTDSHVAQHGTHYFRGYGKTAPEHTYGSVQPNLILVHSGTRLLRPMAQVSSGRYNDMYATYDLADIPACLDREVLVSIRADSVERVAPALARFAPRPVIVPTK